MDRILAWRCLIDELKICTSASKINVTPKGAYLPLSKLHSILAEANLLAHNNVSQIYHCGFFFLNSFCTLYLNSFCTADFMTGLLFQQAI